MHVLARKEIYIVAKHVITHMIFGGCYMITKEQLAKLIDRTLLKTDATKEYIKRLCEEAKKYGFWSLCVNPTYTSLTADARVRESKNLY
jgi:deoxyribose-phosphate aldolase